MSKKGIQKDYTRERFNRLLVIECLGKIRPPSRIYYWKCMCDCGNEVVCPAYDFTSGETKSCGCYRNEIRIKHGLSGTSAYQRQRTLKYEFRISPERYADMLKEQNNCCAICLNLFTDTPAVDHDHSCCGGRSAGKRKTCGKCVRGLLCINCNAALGSFNDNIQTLLNAVSYLKRAHNMSTSVITPIFTQLHPISAYKGTRTIDYRIKETQNVCTTIKHFAATA